MRARQKSSQAKSPFLFPGIVVLMFRAFHRTLSSARPENLDEVVTGGSFGALAAVTKEKGI
jgi:hypothetical protein